MTVTINAKGTSVPYFKIGKGGTTLYQGATDPTTLYTVHTGDYWLNGTSFQAYTGAAWSAIVPKPAGANTQVQYNNSGVQAGSTSFTYVDSTRTLTLANGLTGTKNAFITTADSADTNLVQPSLTIKPGSGNSTTNSRGGILSLIGGTTVSTGTLGGIARLQGGSSTDATAGTGGTVQIVGGTGYTGGTVTISSAGATGTDGNAGNVTIGAGSNNSGTTVGTSGNITLTAGVTNTISQPAGNVSLVGGSINGGVPSGATAGNVLLSGGSANATAGTSGSVIISGGYNAVQATGGYVQLAVDNAVNALKIMPGGEWQIGASGAGTTGQTLVSQGTGASPIWSSAGTGTVTSVSVVTANGVSGTVATATSTPAITLSLGNIIPTSVVSSGQSAFGGATQANAIVNIGATNPLTSVSQIGVSTAFTATSAATTGVAGFFSAPGTAATAFTTPYVADYRADVISKGAGSTITNAVGYLGLAQTVGTNNAVFSDNTSFTGNWFINQSGSANSTFGGTITAANAIVNGLGANQVVYTSGSKVLSSSGSFSYDGNGFSSTKQNGFGINYAVNAAVTVGGSGITSTTQYGINASYPVNSTATVASIGMNVLPTTAASAFTVPYVADFAAQAVVLGAGSTVTRAIGVYAPTQTVGTNNATITDNLAFTGNWFLNQSGTGNSTLGGNLLIGRTTSSGSPYRVELDSTSDTRIGFDVAGTLTGIIQATSNAFNVAATGASSVLNLSTNSTTRAQIDTLGQIGIGVTPNTWETGTRVIQMNTGGGAGTSGDTGAIWARNDSMRLINGAYYNGSNYILSATGVAPAAFTVGAGTFSWQSGTSGTAGGTSTVVQTMVLDTNGNLGVGTSTTTGARVTLVGGVTDSGGEAHLRITSSTPASIPSTIGTGSSGAILQVFGGASAVAGSARGGQIDFFGGGNGGVLLFRTGTGTGGTAQPEVARFDANGILGIGNTPSAWRTGTKAIQYGTLGSVSVQQNGTNNLIFGAYESAANTFSYTTGTDAPAAYSQIAGAHFWSNAPTGTINTTASFTNRMFLDASGNFTVGLSSTNVTNGGFVVQPNGSGAGISNVNIGHISGAASATPYMQFTYNNSVIGNITQNSTTGVLFGSPSDYRLKNNPVPVTGSGEFIDALLPKTWTWAQDGTTGIGFIAHEFQKVSPSSVAGEKDAVDTDGNPVYQSMEASTSEVIAMMVAELQSLRKRVADLEAKQ